MNWIDKLIAPLAPSWAAQRAAARHMLEAYEAAKPSRTNRAKAEHRSGDAALFGAGRTLRGQARWLDENHDLVVGLLDGLVTNVVGRNGIGVEPMPFSRTGELHQALAKQISDAWSEWSVLPTTDQQLTRQQAERLICLTWLRDGEAFGQHVAGIGGYKHATDVPYAIELIEPDLCPSDLEDRNKGITQGVERDAWGRVRGYHMLLEHPGNGYSLNSKTKFVPAEQMMHIKHTRRLHQARGVSILHAVLMRLNDLREYEESERVAARISAAMVAYIKRSADAQFNGGQRSGTFPIAPGIVFDGLMPGEDVGTIQSNRPSTLLSPFRDAMLRAVAAGTRGSASSISRHYQGSYSSQRQELVESHGHYGVLQDEFIAQWSRRVYRRWLATAIASGRIKVPADVEPSTLYWAAYTAPTMPWIDPVKEIRSWVEAIRGGLSTEAEAIRARGKKPQEVKEQRKREVAENREAGLVFDSDAANDTAPSAPDTQDNPDEE